MKILAILCLCLSSQFALALSAVPSDSIKSQYNPERIYKALAVNPVKMLSENSAVKNYRKTVGGLFCDYHENSLHPGNSGYYCQVTSNEKLINFEAIYIALKVREVSLSSHRPGSFLFTKAVGGLVCAKSGTIMEPRFSCTLN